jgi:SIR2-like domain
VQAETLHHTSWERDLETLIDGLARRPTPPLERAAAPPAPARVRPFQRGRSRRTDAGRVACYLAEGSLVTILGSGANAVDRDGPWRSGGGSLPDTTDLARHLARQFGVGLESDDLARISQYVCLLDGKVDLYRTLRELLVKAPCAPASVHRFVAGLPGRLRDIGSGGPQLLVTTNYDTALERAFDAVHEPYDLAVFVGSGDYKGRFVHVPWWDPDEDGARPILVPNEYVDFPIDEDGTLERSVIVKLHGGAVDLRNGAAHVGGDFVITEDDYIGYLTQGPVESLIPLQILSKLRESHFLFLGYRVRDWTLRVFLQRIWSDQPLQARSWAVDPEPDVVERELWEELGVDVVEAPLAPFTAEVARELEGPDDARATA